PFLLLQDVVPGWVRAQLTLSYGMCHRRTHQCRLRHPMTMLSLGHLAPKVNRPSPTQPAKLNIATILVSSRRPAALSPRGPLSFHETKITPLILNEVFMRAESPLA